MKQRISKTKDSIYPNSKVANSIAVKIRTETPTKTKPEKPLPHRDQMKHAPINNSARHRL